MVAAETFSVSAMPTCTGFRLVSAFSLIVILLQIERAALRVNGHAHGVVAVGDYPARCRRRGGRSPR